MLIQDGSDKPPRFSIVTVVYNAKSLFIKTVKSLRSQCFLDYEFIVIDGASDDGTVVSIERNSDIIDYFVSEKDFGIYDAMNKGIRSASGEFVFFLNAGDVFYDRNVLKEVDSWIKCAGAFDIFHGCISIKNKVLGFDKKAEKKQMIKKTICHQSAFIRRALFKEKGGYDCSYKLKADHEWFVRVCGFASYRKIPVVICNYDVDGVSSRFKIRMWREHLRIIFRYSIFIEAVFLSFCISMRMIANALPKGK